MQKRRIRLRFTHYKVAAVSGSRQPLRVKSMAGNKLHRQTDENERRFGPERLTLK